MSKREPRFWAMSADSRDGHLEPFGSNTGAVVDEEAGGVILYGHIDVCYNLVDLLNKVEERAKR